MTSDKVFLKLPLCQRSFTDLQGAFVAELAGFPQRVVADARKRAEAPDVHCATGRAGTRWEVVAGGCLGFGLFEMFFSLGWSWSLGE